MVSRGLLPHNELAAVAAAIRVWVMGPGPSGCSGNMWKAGRSVHGQ